MSNRVSSAFFLYSNLKEGMTVKSIETLAANILGRNGKMESDAMAMALQLYRILLTEILECIQPNNVCKNTT